MIPLRLPFFMRLLYLLFPSILILTSLVSAQTTRAPSSQLQSLNYVKRMEASKRLMHWGHQYYESYQKTKEYRYLKLSFNYCKDGVASYHATQKRITQTNKFSFIVKTERLRACFFCSKISKESSHLPVKQQLKPVDSRYCTEDIH